VPRPARWTAVTLDAVGTLLALREPVGTTYARIAAAHGIHVEPRAVEQRFRRAFAAARPPALATAAREARETLERQWWSQLVSAALDIPAPSAVLDAIAAACWSHYAEPSAWAVYPEVSRVLARLRDRGLRLAIVSNADRRLAQVLTATGLAAAVDTVVLSSRVGATKPDPAIFRVALAELRATARDTVHVGDSLDTDVAGAGAAGLAVVWLDRRAPSSTTVPRDVPRITSLSALPDLLEVLR